MTTNPSAAFPQPARERGAWPHARRPHVLAALLLAGLLLPLAGCSFGFIVDEQIPEQTIQGAPIGSIPEVSFDLDLQSEEEFQSKTFNQVDQVEVRGLTLRILPKSNEDSMEDGDADTWDFVSSAEIRIVAMIDGQQQEQVVAFVNADNPQLANGVRELVFDTTREDILPFVFAEGGYTVKVVATGNAPPDDVIFVGDVQYRLVVDF